MEKNHKKCEDIIKAKVDIENMKNNINEIKQAVKIMAETANRIWLAVLAALLSLLGNVIMLLIKGLL